MSVSVTNKPSLGGSFGQAFGSGLQALANQKIQQIQQRNQMGELSKALQGQGYSPQEAQSFSQLPPELQKIAFKEKQQLPGRQAYAQALGLGGEQNTQQEGFQNPGLLAGLNEKQASEIAKMRQKEAHYDRKERAEAFKQTKAERKEFIDKAKAGKQNLQDLNRLEELEKEGLASPGYTEFLKNSGFDIPTLQGASTEEFNKIAANFIKNARTYFGSRISNFELESFLKTIPNLSQSPEGRKRVISNLKSIARLEVEAGKAAREIIDKHKGIPPLDLMERVEKKLDKKADKLAKKFKEDLAKSVPERQNPLATVAQSLLGSVVGAPGKLLGGIGSALSKLGGIVPPV